MEPLEEDLQRRMRQTSSWASWSPGLVSAVKVAIREFVNKGGQLKKLKMSLEDWRRHVAQNHLDDLEFSNYIAGLDYLAI